VTKKTPKCCEEGIGSKAHPQCLTIDIPPDDDFYSIHGRRCMNFVRNQV
jgi:Animal haem peroxidase